MSDVLFLARICFLSLSCNYISILYIFGARVVLMQWVVLCLCLGRKKGMERGTLGATTDTSAWSCFHHLAPHNSTWAFTERHPGGDHGYIRPARSRFHLQLDHAIPHSHIIPQPGHILKVFISALSLLSGAHLDAVFIFSWFVIHVLMEIHVSWKTRLLIRVCSKYGLGKTFWKNGHESYG